jgi:hypothetical protein
MVVSVLLSAFVHIGAIPAALAVTAHGGSTPLTPDGIPEPLASSCRAEAKVAFAAELKAYGPEQAVQSIQGAYFLVANIDPRYLEFQRQGQIEMTANNGVGAATNRLRACLYGVRLQMLGGSVPQYRPR